MFGRGLAALCAVAAIACAGQAGATVMTATVSGSFDPIRQGPNHEFIGGGWSTTLTYDTSFGVLSGSGGDDHILNWSAAAGGPSPVTSVLLTAYGNDGTSYSYTLDSFTGFTLYRSFYGTALSFSTAGIGFAGSTYNPNRALDFGVDLSVDALYFDSTWQSGLNPVSSNIHTPDFSGSAYTNFMSIAPAPVPEPSTWALLILGFGGIGAALRYRRNGGLLNRGAGVL
jgi:hypothetical protein